MCRPKFLNTQETSQHGYELHCIFEQVDADEDRVGPQGDEGYGVFLHHRRPFKIPTEVGFGAKATCNV
jgi:hypothetical protein